MLQRDLDRVAMKAEELLSQLRHGLSQINTVEEAHPGLRLTPQEVMDLAAEEQMRILEHANLQKPRGYIAGLVVKDAQARGLLCAITMEPITMTTSACVGPCYHTFQTKAIQDWLKTSRTCPVCRQPCCL
jgi:hypothetical protein